MNRQQLRIYLYCFLLTSLVAVGASQGQASETSVAVTVTGYDRTDGRIGCALFDAPSGFPMERAVARVRWANPGSGGVECRFEDVPPGTYAVAVSHDLNANGKTDTNFLGMPTEAWGVSNNVRPRLRAPTFAEAAFEVVEGHALVVPVELDR